MQWVPGLQLTVRASILNFKIATFYTDMHDFFDIQTYVIEMRANSVGINCIIVKAIVHPNTVCLIINRFSIFYQNILVLM